MALWSTRRLGELIALGQEQGSIAKRGKPKDKTGMTPVFRLSDIGVEETHCRRAKKLAAIIRKYVQRQAAHGDEISKAENDENTCRAPLKLGEAVAQADRIAEAYRPVAEAIKTSGGIVRPKNNHRADCPMVSESSKQDESARTNAVAAKAVGLSRRNLSPDQRREAGKVQRQIANELRAEDPKKNTQKRVAMLLGVDQKTISNWWEPPKANGVVSNRKIPIANTRPDARVILSPEAKQQAISRVEAGESHTQVAADLGVSRGRISQLAASKKRRAKKDEDAQRLVSIDKQRR